MKPAPSPIASEINQVTPTLLHWSAYSPTVKCDLSSAAYRTKSGTILIDPIALTKEASEEAFAESYPIAIFLTNENHARAADLFRKKWSIPVYAPAEAVGELETTADFLFESSPIPPQIIEGLQVIPIPGATKSETAFLSPEGVLFLGDAIINLDSHPFSLLPKKYCWNMASSQDSLKKLLDYDFSIVTFAHGLPLRTSAKERLSTLLE